MSLGIVLSLLFVLPSAMANDGKKPDSEPTNSAIGDAGCEMHLGANGSTVGSFFVGDPGSIDVRAPDLDDKPMRGLAAVTRQRIADFYGDTEVLVLMNGPAVPTRALEFTTSLAEPGHPVVHTMNDVPTLFLHTNTANDDLTALLEQALQCRLSASHPATPVIDETNGEAANGWIPGVHVPEVLAMRSDDDEPLPTLPVADSSPRDTQIPIALATATIAFAGAGVLLARRGQSRADEAEAEAEAAAELESESADPEPLLPLPAQITSNVDDSSVVRPRVISLDHKPLQRSPHAPSITAERRPVDTNSRAGASVLSRLVGKFSPTPNDVVHGREAFAELLDIHWTAFDEGGANGAIASIALSELGAVRLRLGNQAADRLFNEVAFIIAGSCRADDMVGLTFDDRLAVLMPNITQKAAQTQLNAVVKKIASTTFKAAGERVLLTPTTGFAMLSDTDSLADVLKAAEDARAMSRLHLHLDAERWDPSMSQAPDPESPRPWSGLKEKLRTPVQIAITIVFAWVVPFWTYLAMDAAGLDISFVIYVVLVAALVITGAFILAEGVMAVKQKEPPELPPEAFPKATALIAAYMPNEAATIIETIDAFLAMDYPNDLQIILAYNTPDPMPVEEHLDRIAAKNPNFVPVRIDGSNSKAQNVNAALSLANGKFIGMFDADHQPRPDAFTRAWRWISDGYDVVQGHCLTRNGDASWLAKMIAVEFEAIYAVAHPGRAKMHRFGVFGGSNGFWRTELLHETRMRGSMLTEDIDSSMRVIENGGKIRSDRLLVSRELATTTFEQVWNQRMRWAQGWFQVSLQHMKYVYKSSTLTARQKFGILHLLVWRELYPWISQQLFPLLAFWAVKSGGITRLDWTVPIFVATSIFTFSVGPIQAIYAYRLADPEIKQHKKWFWGYLLFTTPFYTEYKNLIARVAHVKQFMGESNWRVTPRSADPAPGPGG